MEMLIFQYLIELSINVKILTVIMLSLYVCLLTIRFSVYFTDKDDPIRNKISDINFRYIEVVTIPSLIVAFLLPSKETLQNIIYCI